MTWDAEVAEHRAEVRASYAVLRRTPRHDLRWVTVINAAWVVRLGDETAALVRDAAAGLDAEWRQTLMRGGRIRRDPRGHTRMVGVKEIDLLHPALLCSDMKRALLAEFDIDVGTIREWERILILHSHVLVDGRGHASWAALERDLRAQWPGPRRVHVARIYSTGTVSENIERLADYSVKFKFVYSKANLGKSAEFTRQSYGKEWTEYIKEIYRKVEIRKLLISTVKSRADGSRVYGENENCTAEIDGIHQLQLEEDTKNPKGILDIMKIKDILPYINLNKMTSQTLRDLCDALDRASTGTSREYQLGVQYGDEEGEIEIEQARLDLDRTRAEVERLRAEAVAELADAGSG